MNTKWSVYCSACDQHFMASSVAGQGLHSNLRHLTAMSHKENLANALEADTCLDCRDTSDYAPSVRDEMKYFVSIHHTDFKMSSSASFGSTSIKPRALCKHCTKSKMPRSFDNIKDMKAHMISADHVKTRNAKQ